MRMNGPRESVAAYQERVKAADDLAAKAAAGEQLTEGDVTRMRAEDVPAAMAAGAFRDLGCPPSKRRYG
jgi:hypothetical protein